MRMGFYGVALAVVLTAMPASAEMYDAADMRDRTMITDVMMRYGHALDTADPDAYAAVFTDDAVLHAGGGTETGRDEIKKMVAGIREQFKLPPLSQGQAWLSVRHVITNIVLDIDGNTATGSAYWQTIRRNADGVQPTIAAMGRYEDSFVKVDGHWLIQERSIISDMMVRAPE